jgi:dolichol-phosphate mannosyltransferase
MAVEQAGPALSVVVPVHDEGPNIAPLIGEIFEALDGRISFEIIYVDDGSQDETAATLKALRERHATLRVLRHRARAGQSAALVTGVRAARAPWIVTLDGDGQNDPRDIPALLARRDQAGAGKLLVAGVRLHRQDSLAKRWASRAANAIRRRLLGDPARDSGCGLKLFPRAAFLDLPHFDHMHRFLPALFNTAGLDVIEQPVSHRPRVRGRSHYGILDRAMVGLVDLFGVAWLQRRSRRPIVEPEDQA